MLQAILNGKARRVSLMNEETQSWRTIFQQYEDLLTAAFWGRITYLSDESLKAFISAILECQIDNWGEFESVNFWPKYKYPRIIEESVRPWINNEDQFAEPDVVLLFEHAALIIEVKPPAGGQQYQQQWCKEIYAWLNSDEKKPKLFFLALGNLPKDASQHFSEVEKIFGDVTCSGLEWNDVRDKLTHPVVDWHTRQDQRIVDDCLKALALYGIRMRLRPWQPFLNFLSTQSLPADIAFIEGNHND